MTDKELTEVGYSIPIFRAVEAAGGLVPVAFRMGLKSTQAVQAWYVRRNIPAARIHLLCELGGFKVAPGEILKDITKQERATA